MRSAAVMAANMDIVREVGAKATFRKTHLEFDEVSRSDGTTFSNGQAHDVDNFGTGFLRVASVFDASWVRRLYFQYVSNPDGSWPAWSNSGVVLEDDSRPGLYGARVFYCTSARAIQYRDFNGTGFGSATTLFTDAAGTITHMIAPVSQTDFYVYWQTTPQNGIRHGYIKYRNTSGTEIAWTGVLYGQGAYPFFDAVRIGAKDYIFFTEADNRRTMMMTRYNLVWSDPVPVIPLDLEDEYSSFQLGGVSVINGKIFITGRLKRNYGSPMQVYLYGTKHFSMGRDFVIAVKDTQTKAVLFYDDVETTTILLPAGKLLTSNNDVWHVGLGIFDKAAGTLITGYDNPNFKYETQDIIQANYAHESNAVSRMTMSLKSSVDSPIIASGNELTLEVSYGGQYATIGKFEILATSKKDEPNGKRYDLVCESLAMHRINEWKADASYDYWSQTKVGLNSGQVVDLSKLIRGGGIWSNSLTLESINEPGFLYSVEKPGRNMLVRADFDCSPELEKFQYGIVLNYYRETKKEAAVRLNKAEEDIKDSDFGHNGIVAAYTHDVGNGSPGFILYLLRSNNWTVLASANYEVDHPSTSYFAASFQDGVIRILATGDDGVWQEVLTYRFQSFADDPWVRDEMLGRGGVFAKRITAKATSYPISSTDSIIPLNSLSGFPFSGSVVIDNEEISYSGRGGSAMIDNITYYEGEQTYGPGNLSAFDGEPVGHPTYRALRQSFTPDQSMVVKSVKLWSDKEGFPSYNFEIGIYKNTGSGWGERVGGGSFSDVNAGGYVYTLSTPASIEAGQQYYLVISPEGMTTDGNNFYYFFYQSGNPFGGGVLQYYNGSSWVSENGDLRFELRGMSGVSANRIALSGLPEPSYPTVYNDMALYVKSGRGTGNTFKVVGYADLAGTNIGMLTLDRDIAHLVGKDSVFSLLPTLRVSERGANGTTATSHSRSTCHLKPESGDILDPDPSIQVTSFQYCSMEEDIRLEDMIAEIAGKAGVEAVIDTEFLGLVNFNSATLDATTGRANEINRRNCIVKISPNSWSNTEFGVMARRFGNDGLALTLTNTRANYYTYHSGTFNLIESVPLGITPSGTVTFSVYDKYLSVWIEGRHIHTFVSEANMNSGTAYVIGKGTPLSLNVDWSQLDLRVDNYILDMGRSGLQLINDLVRERRVFFQDDQYGRIRAFRNRVQIPDEYSFAVVNSNVHSKIGIVSRTRIIGGEIVELHDPELLKTFGNVFMLGNSERLDSAYDIYEEIERGYQDIRGYREKYSFAGALDPRLEPNDIVTLSLPGRDVDVVVDSMMITLSRTREDMILDMNVEAHKHEAS